MYDNKKTVACMILLVFLTSCALKLFISVSVIPKGEKVIIDWGDNWSFLSVIEHIRRDGVLPKEDLFFSGIPYVYPPLSLILYTILYTIIPVNYIIFSNYISPIIGSIAVFAVYYLTYKVTKNPWIGILAAYFTLFSPRYMSLSSIPIPEMIGHIIAPIFLYLLYVAATSGKRNHALLAGFAGAALFLNHHLTAAILFMTAITYFIFYSLTSFLHSIVKAVRKGGAAAFSEFLAELFSNAKILAVVFAVSFLFSSPWWIDTNNKDIMNLVVREQEYGVPPFYNYVQMLGPHVAYLGFISLILFIPLAAYKKDKGLLLMLSWGLLTLFATQSRAIVPKLVPAAATNQRLLWVLAPIYGERYFDYMAQPFAIITAFALVNIVWKAPAILRKARLATLVKPSRIALTLLLLAPIAYSTLSYGFDESDLLMKTLDERVRKLGYGDPHLDVGHWAMWRMKPDVNKSYEYEAALWMRDNLPENANIVTDYPGGEVISAGSIRKITSGAELRVTVDVVGVYTDIANIYFTENATEAASLMKKRGATHVYVCTRMIKRGWLAITSHSRWPKYSIGSGMGVYLDEEKFRTGPCFKTVYDTPDVRVYELVC